MVGFHVAPKISNLRQRNSSFYFHHNFNELLFRYVFHLKIKWNNRKCVNMQESAIELEAICFCRKIKWRENEHQAASESAKKNQSK